MRCVSERRTLSMGPQWDLRAPKRPHTEVERGGGGWQSLCLTVIDLCHPFQVPCGPSVAFTPLQHSIRPPARDSHTLHIQFNSDLTKVENLERKVKVKNQIQTVVPCETRPPTVDLEIQQRLSFSNSVSAWNLGPTFQYVTAATFSGAIRHQMIHSSLFVWYCE